MPNKLVYLKALALGTFIACLGVITYIVFDSYSLEENVGLDTLFKLRGKQTAPEEVVIIAIEKESSDYFNLPNHPAEWTRDKHAQLINRLTEAGAASITFDLFFKKHRTDNQDNRLANAIKNAERVVLFTHLKREIKPLTNNSNDPLSASGLNIERLIPPIPKLADGAIALAPFALPKYPIKVTRFWTYRVPAGDIPNIPAVTLQLYNREGYGWLRQQLLDIKQSELPTFELIIQQRSLQKVMVRLRTLFNRNPDLAQHLRALLINSPLLDANTKQQASALITLYGGGHRHYLNFYGPPWTITTIPYYKVLSSPLENLNLVNKAVFVGFSERLQPEQKDNFNTVYSQTNGLDLSGVEIAATAFANLLQQNTITPLQPLTFISLIFLYGFVIAFISRTFKPALAVSSIILLAVVYFGVSIYLFKQHTIWLPWVIPVLFLTPITLLMALSWHYFDAYRERKHIRAAFGMYLPGNVVNEISKQRGPLKANQKIMYGIVLSTDAAEYTHLAEQLSAVELGELMNQYYELLFQPIKDQGGIISDVVGDAMMAIWSSAESNAALRQKACIAAIMIRQNLNLAHSLQHALPTRIGLHAGEIVLGNIGAVNHYEYRAVGDIVNTATRIESFNKQIGTRCLASADVLVDTEGLLHRELGTFRLVGKTHPIILHEIITLEQFAKDNDFNLCHQFTEGVSAYRKGDIGHANGIFTKIINQFPNDGPSQFYVQLCALNKDTISKPNWNGVITINKK